MDRMALSRLPSAALGQAIRLLGTAPADQTAIRQAEWVARCVDRGQTALLTPDPLTALAATLTAPHAARLEVSPCGSTAAASLFPQ